MRVYICGAETIDAPLYDEKDNLISDKLVAERYQKLGDFLEFELAPYFFVSKTALSGKAVDRKQTLEAIGFDPANQIASLFKTHPTRGVPVVAVAVADALKAFAPDVVMVIGGGINPDKEQDSAIAQMMEGAVASGVLIRDVQNIG